MFHEHEALGSSCASITRHCRAAPLNLSLPCELHDNSDFLQGTYSSMLHETRIMHARLGQLKRTVGIPASDKRRQRISGE